MAKFILVHGSWHGAWCWREVVPLLASLGHEALAIDLPGHGEDRTPADQITSRHYVDCIVTALRAASEPPVLVGHSLGGAMASQAVELIPDRTRALICVASLVPPSGGTMMRFVASFDPEYLAEFQWSPDQRTGMISLQGLQRFFYSDCPPAFAQSV